MAKGTETVIGIIGTGDMGSAIGLRLLEVGFPVVAYDLVPQAVANLVAKGATAANSVAAVAALADIVAIVVDGEESVESVAAQLEPSLRPGTAVVIHSTVRPATVTALAERLGAVGALVCDASVNGGSEKAVLGKMTLMVGGSDDAVKRIWPMLEGIGENLLHVGPPGAGMAAKLVNNAIAISGYTAQIEAMQLAAAYGLDEDAVTSFVAVSWGDCRHIRTWGRMDRRRRERSAADAKAYTRMSRDLLNAVDAAQARGVAMPMVRAAADLLPGKLAERDAELDRHPTPAPPRCSICNIELAAPFREAGTHPECREGCH